MTYGTAGIHEIIWTSVFIIGVVVSVLALIDALKTLFYLEALGQNGVRALIARGNVANESLRLAINVIAVAAGVFLLSSPPINQATPVPYQMVGLNIGLICMGVLIQVASFSDLRRRNRAIDMLVEASRVRAAMVPEQIQRDAEAIKERAAEVEQGAEEIRAKAANMQQDQVDADSQRERDKP